jgi:hypothetical protein
MAFQDIEFISTSEDDPLILGTQEDPETTKRDSQVIKLHENVGEYCLQVFFEFFAIFKHSQFLNFK